MHALHILRFLQRRYAQDSPRVMAQLSIPAHANAFKNAPLSNLINTPINQISPRQQRRTDEPTTRKGSETHNRGVGGERSAMHAEVRLQALGLISPLLRHSSRSMHDRESTRLAIILFGKRMHDAFDKNIAQITSG